MPARNNFQNPGRVITGNIDSQSSYHDKRIQAALSTQIVIKAQGVNGGWYDVGAIQSFQVSENRNINHIQEVGTDGIVQSHPSGAQPVNLTVTRAIFDYQRVTVAFQRGFHHVMSQRFPFDIVVVDYNPYVFQSSNRNYDGPRDTSSLRHSIEDSGPHTIRTRFVNCWFNANQYSYMADNYMITENATITAEAVYDTNIDFSTIVAQDGHDAIEAIHDRSWLGSVMTEAYADIGTTKGIHAREGETAV